MPKPFFNRLQCLVGNGQPNLQVPSRDVRACLRATGWESNIRPGDAAVLDEAIATLKANPNVVINVNGYFDAIGGDEYSLKLSQYRGNAVANYLLSGGILATQLRVHGYAKTDFVATNDMAEGRAQNRRVELVLNQ